MSNDLAARTVSGCFRLARGAQECQPTKALSRVPPAVGSTAMSQVTSIASRGLCWSFRCSGSLAFYSAIPSALAVIVAVGTEVLLFLVFLEWKTYRIRVSAGSITQSSVLHSKSFALSEVDLIQHVYGGRGAQSIYIRHGDKILLKIFGELLGFDDLLGFLREYAKHRHLIFDTGPLRILDTSWRFERRRHHLRCLGHTSMLEVWR